MSKDEALIPWIRGVTVGIITISVLAAIVSLITHTDPLFGLEVILVPVVVIAMLAGVFAGPLAAALGRLPSGVALFVFAAVLLPLCGTVGALWLPEFLIEVSNQASWAWREGWNISLATPLAVAVIAAIAMVQTNRRPAVVLGITLLALGLSILGRDVGIRAYHPSWCFADTVQTYADGGVSVTGDATGCTVILPEEDQFARP